MALRTVLFIFLSIGLSTVAQVILKAGMSSARVAEGLASGDRAAAVLTVATTPSVILGLALYGLGAVSWLMVLARADLSMAYPFLGLSFVVTTLLAALFLGEHVTVLRGLGTLLIVGGVYLVAVS